MKSILFDVDGVFLSEERCFDVSALTVDELLHSENYLGLQPIKQYSDLTDDQIQQIRNEIFQNDKILNHFKSLGLNSNWDMLFIVFSIHFIHILKKLSKGDREAVLSSQHFTVDSIAFIKQHLNQQPSLSPLNVKHFLSTTTHGKTQIYESLKQYAQQELEIVQDDMFNLKSTLWHFTQEVYQEWYLGQSLYEEIEQKKPRSTFKKGFIFQEILLRPEAEIQQLLHDLNAAGYQLAVATGRPRTETIVPFKSFSLLQWFDQSHIVTASEVLTAESQYPSSAPLGKPNPFSYIATLNGNHREHYSEYIKNQNHIVCGTDVYIVGDSLADLLCAKKIGATFIGTLTGLSGKSARLELEQHGADFIINHVGEIRSILL